MSKITLNPAGMSLGRHQRALKRRLQRMTKILQSRSPLDVFPASTKTFNFIAFGFSLMLEGHFYTLNDGFTLLQPQQNWEASSNPKKCGCEFWIWLFFPIQPYFRCSDSNRAPVTVWVVAFAIFVWCEMSLPFCAFCNVYRLCQTHRPPLSWDGTATGVLSSPGGEPTIQRSLLFLLHHILPLGLTRKPFPSTQAYASEGPERPHHPANWAGRPNQKLTCRQPPKERRCLLLRVLVPEPVDRLQW